MPLVRISLREGKTEEYKKALADGVHRALVEAMDVPAQDRFQMITEHPAGGLIYDPNVSRRCNAPTTSSWCRSHYPPDASWRRSENCIKRMAEILAENPGLRPQDLMINLVEVAWENWSFGNGEAQYTV